MLSDAFYLDVWRIHVAHQYTLDRAHICTYPKGRGHYGLVYALEGEAEYRFLSGKHAKMVAGDLLFLFPDTAYTIKTEMAFRHYTVNFDLHENSSAVDMLGSEHCLLHSESAAATELTFRKLVHIWDKKATGYEMQSVGLLYELLTLLYTHHTEELRSPAYRRLLPAKEYIEQHYAEPISLSQLAFLCNMSPSHFRREWKRFSAESPLQYRDTVRLSYAQEHLYSGYYTVSEIAEKCGFEDPSYFIRFFKKKIGFTPGEVKKGRFSI